MKKKKEDKKEVTAKSYQTNYVNSLLLELPFVQPEVEELKRRGKRGRFNSDNTQSILNFLDYLSNHVFKSSNQHKTVKGAYSFSKNQLIGLFGKRGYNDIQAGGSHFFNKYFTKDTSFKGDRDNKQSNAYRITDDFLDQYVNIYLDKLLLSNSPQSEFLECIYKEHFDSHIRVDDNKFGLSNKPKGSDFKLPCRINTKKPTREAFRSLSDLFDIYSVQRYADLDNRVEIHYNEKSFRLWNDYSYINLQGLRKDLRGYLLEGHYDYDIINAIPTVLLQDYNSNYKGETLSNLEEYVENPLEVRNRLSKETGLTIKTIKKTIIAVANGSNPLDKIEGEHYKQVEESEEDLFAYEDALKSNRLLRGILRDIRSLRGAIKSALGVCSDERYYELERKLLDGVIGYLRDNPPQLLIHDGFTTLQEIDLEEMEDKLYWYSGIKVKYTEDYLLKSPLRDVA